MLARNVEQLAGILEKEVMMVTEESGQRQPLPGRPRSNSGINR